MQGRILYLDSSRSKAVSRALRRFGSVDYACDINSALCLVAENEYDYYFIQADVPEARSLIKHLRHDSDLRVPCAIVLLTDNKDEDCEAWKVDSYVTANRIAEDAPYIFSHYKPDDVEPTSILRLASMEPDASAESGTGAGTERVGADSAINRKRTSSGARPFSSALPRIDLHLGRKPVIVAICLLLLAGCLWLFSFGPLGGHGKGGGGRERKVEADTSGAANLDPKRTMPALPPGYSSSAPQEAVPSAGPPRFSSSPVDTTVREDSGDDQVKEVETKAFVPAPEIPPTDENHHPSVSISGPALVAVGQTVTYHANASDPDGDSISYSWGGPSRSTAFQNTGSYPISVTVTDSRGLSASASMIVTVRQ